MLKEILLYPPLQIYFVTLIITIFRYPKYFDSKLKYLPVLLMYIFLTELLGLIINLDSSKNPFFNDLYSKYNFIIFIVYDLMFFGYFFYLFWHFCCLQQNKKIILIGSTTYALTFLINAMFTNIIIEPQLYSYNIGSLIIILAAFIFLKEKIQTRFFKKNALFWISIGLLIFHIGFIPINILYSFSTMETKTMNYILPKFHLALVFLMYGSFIYGFIQMKGKLKV
ncbi:hypothetical protein Celal_0493 [Cellulophaga algicola DSM 14237]|uniref:Uncharacterized protein n=1 Tax=Cellulophaga algicola (strain DSM 14237 / IC166 / ACAM 630) TaxID=688270 RepID=E6XAZ1_CELAD|nr:hypothetical protein [Cellulophaga algicola]ADV47832.1 hypothetical protein Celal_0493 [Cellulophaga algicola DSM 14237]